MNKILNRDPETKKFAPEFSIYFERLLQPVDQWILTEIVDDWRHSLNGSVSVEEYYLFANTAKNYLYEKRKSKNYDITWLKTIIYITLQRLSRKLEEPVIWTREFVEQSSNKAVEANEVVFKAVLELYNTWSSDPEEFDKGFAQPYAFNLIFEVVAEDEVLHNYIMRRSDNDPIKMYLATTENGNTTLNNRITNFACEFYKNGKKLIAPVDFNIDINSIEHFKDLDLRTVNIDGVTEETADQRRVTVTAMGIMGSGKSTILKRIRHVLTNPSKTSTYDANFAITQLGVVKDVEGEGEAHNFFGPISKRTYATKLDRTQLTGEIRINNQQYPLSFNDTRGGIMLEAPPDYDKKLSNLKEKNYPLESLLIQTDLLLIVMDPETIFYRDPDETFTFGNLLDLITSRLNYLFHYSKHSMIAIVFTKFDEYGSVIKGPRNLIHSLTQGKYLKEYLSTGSDQVLEKLIAEIASTYTNKNRETALQHTIVLLLQRIKYLLKTIVFSKQHPVINFYVASTAAMNDEENSAWTGISEIFDDFANYFGWLIKKKELNHIIPPTEVKVLLNNFQPNVEFLNSNNFNVLCTIERKENDGDYGVLERDKTVYSETKSAFKDTSWEYDKSYTYRLYFSNLSKENLSKYSLEVSIEIPKKPKERIFPPVDLFAEATDINVSLEWKNINNVPVRYKLEKKEQGATYADVFDDRKSNGQFEHYVDSDINFGKNYIYRLRAREETDRENVSEYSEEVKVAIPQKVVLPPSSVKLVLLNEKVTIQWRNENKFPVLYACERKITGRGGWVKLVENAKAQSDDNVAYIDNDAEFGKEYVYRLKHVAIDNESIQSEFIETPPIRTPHMGVKNLKWELKLTNEKPEYIELKWELPDNSYQTYVRILRTVTDENITYEEKEIKTEYNGNSYRDTLIKKGLRYQYRVIIVDPTRENISNPVEETELIIIPKSDSNMLAIILIILVSLVILFLIIKVSGLL